MRRAGAAAVSRRPPPPRTGRIPAAGWAVAFTPPAEQGCERDGSSDGGQRRVPSRCPGLGVGVVPGLCVEAHGSDEQESEYHGGGDADGLPEEAYEQSCSAGHGGRDEHAPPWPGSSPTAPTARSPAAVQHLHLLIQMFEGYARHLTLRVPGRSPAGTGPRPRRTARHHARRPRTPPTGPRSVLGFAQQGRSKPRRDGAPARLASRPRTRCSVASWIGRTASTPYREAISLP